eukprot:3435886-Pyramimonas_sp.AAC.1
MDVPTLRLFALQPDALGGASAKFYGEVSDVARRRRTSQTSAGHRAARRAAMAERPGAVQSWR